MPIPEPYVEGGWNKIVMLADPALSAQLDAALGQGTSARDRALIAGCSGGPSQFTGVVGKNGKLTPTATRYYHFLMSVIDVILLVKGAWDTETIGYFEPSRHTYNRFRDENPRHIGGPLSKHDARVANTMMLRELLNVRTTKADFDFFVENYDALEKYLNLIIARKDMSIAQTELLLATLPEPALADGAL